MSESEIVIPVVDLEDVDPSDAERCERAAAALRRGFGELGLVFVKNHGVDAEKVERLYDAFSELAARPTEEKMGLSRPDLWFQRGYTPPNTEQAVVSSAQPDFKECYFAAPLPSSPELRLQYPQIHADNVWPSSISGFRETYLDVGRELHRAGQRLLTCAALALRLSHDTLCKIAEGGPHVFRLLRYLPLAPAQVGTKIVWGEEHTDFNLLTLLPGGQFRDPSGARSGPPDDASGLFLRTRPSPEHPTGRMVRGVAPPGCIVAQVGQAFEILTGGAFLATPHVITAPHTAGYARLSAAHFVHVHSHETLSPLPQFRTERAIVDYGPPVLAGTYALKTLVDIRLAPPEALDRLGYRHYDRLSALRLSDKRQREIG